MYAGFYEEGDWCPSRVDGKQCKGKIDWPKTVNCSCHISPPCHACTSKVLTCSVCGWQDDPPRYKYIEVAPCLAMQEHRPRPLDTTKIDYRIKMHSSSSQLCEGVYPPGTTPEQVRAVVNGTFGGRFESFGDGKFKFVAYTD